MEHHRTSDLDSLASSVAGWLDDAVRSAAGRYVALAVGDSTLPAFRRLAPLRPGRAVVCLDELVPAPADPSLAFAARLADALPPTWREALRPFAGRFADPAVVEAEVGAGGLAAAVCGLGPDGHVAFNQPPDDGTSRTRLVELSAPNLTRLGDVAPSTSAITLGLATIAAAERLAIVVAGAGKAAALDRLLHGPDGPEFPVTALRDHPGLTVFSIGGS